MTQTRLAGTILILSRSDVEPLLPEADYDAVVASAFRARAEGFAPASGLLHLDASGGEFHVKAGDLRTGGRHYVAIKANGGFFGNPAQGLPAIQGVIYLADGSTGTPLALIDSGAITMYRTGAATAVATRILANESAHVATVCGSGRQARVQLRALARARRLSRAFVWGSDAVGVAAFASEMSQVLRIPVQASADLRRATTSSDLIVTCTPASSPFLGPDDVRPGTFIAAMGADSPGKQELDERLVARSVVIADVREQSATVGEVYHAIVAGLMTAADVRADLGDVLIGRSPGRTTPSETVIFDSTGTAVQDVASAAVVYERAVANGVGTSVALDVRT